jgi:hypothetical protein
LKQHQPSKQQPKTAAAIERAAPKIAGTDKTAVAVETARALGTTTPKIATAVSKNE